MVQIALVRGMSFSALTEALAAGTLAIRTGPLWFRIQTSFEDVARSIHALYADFPCSIAPEFSDYWVEIRAPRNLRRWLRPQTEFLMDGELPFEALPRDQAPALLEWGMNWTIASSCHQWLTIHAASVERGGFAAILPAPPGSGKSTLCASLAFRGWRLLSDEITLLDPANLEAHALARPINVKNQSIDILRAFEPSARWAPEVYDTKKGRVTHLAPPTESVRRMAESATPRWIVFPRYVSGSTAALTQRSKSRTFIELAQNAFNFGTLGEVAFRSISALLDRCDCYDLAYSSLDEALEVFEWMATEMNSDLANTRSRAILD